MNQTVQEGGENLVSSGSLLSWKGTLEDLEVLRSFYLEDVEQLTGITCVVYEALLNTELTLRKHAEELGRQLTQHLVPPFSKLDASHISAFSWSDGGWIGQKVRCLTDRLLVLESQQLHQAEYVAIDSLPQNLSEELLPGMNASVGIVVDVALKRRNVWIALLLAFLLDVVELLFALVQDGLEVHVLVHTKEVLLGEQMQPQDVDHSRTVGLGSVDLCFDGIVAAAAVPVIFVALFAIVHLFPMLVEFHEVVGVLLTELLQDKLQIEELAPEDLFEGLAVCLADRLKFHFHLY